MLLFESAYNIKVREIVQHTRAISILAIFALLVAAIISAGILYFVLGWFGMVIPFLVLFAFGTLISATDPVAVLALFKEMGAPKRLTLIFEGESLFNDGTAIALLLVVLGVLIHDPHAHTNIFNHFMEPLLANMGGFGTILGGFVSFLLMIVIGFVVGGLLGYGASRIIPHIQKAKLLEVAFTLVIAHATFLFAEWINHAIIPVSPVIATTIAAMVLGNYGRYKLSAETRHMMGEYWEFFAFIANSMVFLLVGIMIVGLDIKFAELIGPIIVSIFAVAIARAISVYVALIPLNKMKKEFIIPFEWMHLLSWGSLRGGLAIVMALFIPANFTMVHWPLETSVRDFVLALTVGCIIFTTFVKATTIPVMLKKLKITDPTLVESADYEQGRILFLLKLLAKIDATASRGFVNEEKKNHIAEKYKKELEKAHKDFLQKFPDKADREAIIERMLALHALEIEKTVLVDRFNHDEIPEWVLRRMLNKLDSQIERVEEGKTQIKEAYEHKIKRDPLILKIEKFLAKFGQKRHSEHEKYYKARSRMIVLEKVIARLGFFEDVEEIASSDAFSAIKDRYNNLYQNAKKIRLEMLEHKNIQDLEEKIIKNVINSRKHDIIENLSDSGLISNKTTGSLLEKYLHS